MLDIIAEAGILVGRERELITIEERLAEARRGKGGLIAISGDAGIGKTRLLTAALRAARSMGYTTAATTNFEFARTPLGPWTDLLRVLSGVIRELLPTAPGDRGIFEHAIGVRDQTGPAAFSDLRRFYVIVGDAFARGAARLPIAVGIDDAHWIDAESLELLRFLAGRLAMTRIIVLVSGRDESSVETAAPPLPAIARHPQTTTIRLGPLEPGAMRELVAALTLPQRRLPRGTIDEICRLADGNPLFLAELMRDALAGNEGATLPATVQASALQRVSSLAANHAHIIEAAATIGRAFTVPDLAVISAKKYRDVVEAIRFARDLGIVVETDGRLDSFAFRHELVRKAIYDRMLSAERIQLHRAIAAQLEDRKDGVPPAILAHHWGHAGELARSAVFSERAGDEASLVHAHTFASAQYRHAIESGSLSVEGVARVAEKAGRSYDLAGEPAVAIDFFRRAVTNLVAPGKDAQRLALELAFARAAHRAGRTADMLPACRRVLDSTTDSSLLFGAHSLLAMYFAHRNEIANAQAHFDAADAIEGPHEARDALSLEWARTVAAVFMDDDRWVDSARKAVALAVESGNAALLAYTLMNFAIIARERGHESEAASALDEAITVADENGLSFASAYGRCEKITGLHTAGRLEDARRLLLETAGLHVGATIVRIYVACAGLMVLADLNRVEDIPALSDDSLLDEAFATGEGQHFAPLAAAHAHAAFLAGRFEMAASLTARALEGMSSSAYTSGAVMTFARCAAPCEFHRIEALIGKTPGIGLTRLHHLAIGVILTVRRGQTDEAKRLASVALDVAERINAPLVRAQLLEVLGRSREALAIYESVGALGEIRRLNSRKARALTARESEIANLVSSGLSNRAIAARLSLSERTVEHHAAALYAKLGFRTRSEFIASRGAYQAVRPSRS